MSDVIKKEKKMVDVVIGKKCDICKKESLNMEVVDNEWHIVSAGHQEWDNNSIDSWEYFDVHSPECYFKCLKKLLKKFKDYRYSAEIDGKPYAFIQELVKYVNKECKKT